MDIDVDFDVFLGLGGLKDQVTNGELVGTIRIFSLMVSNPSL